MRRLVLTSLGHVEPEVLGALVPRPEEHDLGGDRLAGHLGLDVKKGLLACQLVSSASELVETQDILLRI